MNPLNYGTQEACKKLVDAGIVLETDFYYMDWHGVKSLQQKSWVTSRNNGSTSPCVEEEFIVVPALTLAEAWRELPQDILYNTMVCSLMMWKFNHGAYTKVGYWWHDQVEKSFTTSNPTDAAIRLLIWLKEKGLYEPHNNT